MKSGHGRRKRRVPAAYALDLAKEELLRLYMADPEFLEQFQGVRQKYKTAICHLLSGTSYLQTTEDDVSEDSDTKIIKALEKAWAETSRVMEIVAEVPDLEEVGSSSRLEEALSTYFPTDQVRGLVGLIKDLSGVAIGFGLDYPWAVSRLLFTSSLRQ